MDAVAMRGSNTLTRPRGERVAEAWRWVELSLDGQPLPPLLIVIGLADGSLLEALEEHAPATRVLALEPSPAQARAFLARRSLNAWRTSGRLVYLADPGYAGADEAWRIFKQKDEPKVLVHPTALQAPGNTRATDVLKKILSGVRANAQARRRFAPRYLTNVLRNIPAIAAGADVRSLSDAYRGMPAVIAAAGPSLDNALTDLHGAAGRVLLIACDTALRPMLHAGLEPQLVVGADPSAANARHFQSLPDCPRTWLVAESALDPTAVELFDGRTYWFRLAPHHPWPWLNALGIDVGLVDMWGSVLTAAFQVACLAGCDPIIVVGADLSHTGGRPYARTTTYELDWAHAVARGETPEETWRGHIAGTRPIERPDLRGVTSTTTPTMLAFRDWLVARAKRSGRRVINATGAGMLFGDGVEQGALATALAHCVDRSPAKISLRHTTTLDRAQMAPTLHAVRQSIGADAASSPIAEWMAFTEGGLDHAALAAALDEAAARLGASPSERSRESVVPFGQLMASDAAKAVFNWMPEAIDRLKVGLSGAAPAAAPSERLRSSPIEHDRATMLLGALAVLGRIRDYFDTADDLAADADPLRVGRAPASALYPWPEAVRWAVVTFEVLLGSAWHRASAMPDVAPIDVTVCEVGLDLEGARAIPARAARACVVLALEWLRCAASLDEAHTARFIEAAGHVSAIEALLRDHVDGSGEATGVVLTLDAASSTERVVLRLPLRVHDSALSARAGGACRAPRLEAAVGDGCGGDLRIVLSIARRSDLPS